MAIAASAAGAVQQRNSPTLVTTNDVTFTLDGVATSLAVAGTAHGGPTGVTPDRVHFERRGGDSVGAIVHGVNVTNFDTTNDEVDYTMLVSAAGTNTETIILRMTCEFYAQAGGGTSV